MKGMSLFSLVVFLAGGLCTDLFAAHGLSIDGPLKYDSSFTRFDYVSSDADKGGDLVLHALGSFDKMNPFTLKGIAPEGLGLYIFEPLTQASLDEPFSQYGLIAKNISVAEDKLSVTFTINEQARFSDGSPVTAEDVKFTIDTLKSDLVHPRFPYYYKDISSAEILDRYRVRFHFSRVNRELPLIAGQISILSKTFYEKNGFSSRELLVPIGSGPYVVDSFQQGKSITYKRNPNYWAIDHPVRKNMFNFDRIIVKYYKDQIVSVEAFKAGEFDIMLVNIAKQWVRDIRGERVETGEIIKNKFAHRNNAGMQGFVMNTRKQIFKDSAVRKALGLAFDFEWTNQALFYDQYSRSNSFFSNSYLAAVGLPSKDELRLLEQYRDILPEEVFTVPLEAPRTNSPGSLRKNLREAAALLQENGWELENGILQNREGTKLSFEIILVSASFERVMAAYTKNLKKIGIEASYRTIDPALYADRINRFDFDMTVDVIPQSLSPGNEQRNFWHSEAAVKKGARNLAGIKHPVVDALVEKIIYSKTREELTASCQALDRVLWYGYYVVPNWYLDGHRIAYHNKFSIPDKLPTYYDYNSLLMTWWRKNDS